MSRAGWSHRDAGLHPQLMPSLAIALIVSELLRRGSGQSITLGLTVVRPPRSSTSRPARSMAAACRNRERCRPGGRR